MIARKRFGQNFLQDKAIIQAIIQAINPQPGQNLLEIGPGQGALTRPLLKHASKLTAIEIDRDLVQQFKTWPDDLIIIEGDALTIDYSSIFQIPSHLPLEGENKIRLIGNLPYNISTPLLLRLLHFISSIQDMHFMLQKEVAERIVASPGSKTYGRLSVMMQYFCHAELLFAVPPDAFFPKPKVDSCVIRLIPHSFPVYPTISFEKLESVVKQAFASRRKTLRNNFKHCLSQQDWEKLQIDSTLRPEQLDIIKFVNIAQFLL